MKNPNAIEPMTKAAQGMAMTLDELREAHSSASRCAQIELLRLIQCQADIYNRAKNLLECMETDERWKDLHARARKVRQWLNSHAIYGVDWRESDSGHVWTADSFRPMNTRFQGAAQ